MPRLDNAIDIKAPPDQVFQYISDVEAQPEWVKWAKSADLTSREGRVLGATDAMLMQVGPKKEKVEAIVTEFRENVLFTRRHTKGMPMTERLSLVPTPEGTKVAWSVEYSPPMGPMGKLMDFLFMERLFEQLMQDSLTNLKEKLETAR